MRFPILYALTYPDRVPTPLQRLDLVSAGRLDFFPLDGARYAAVPLAYEALRLGGSAPAVLNAANEEAVAAFLAERVPFVGIPETIAAVMDAHRVRAVTRLDDVLEADAGARQETGRRIVAGAAAAR